MTENNAPNRLNMTEITPYVSKYYNEHYRHYRMKEHRHNEFEIMYVRKGKCRISCTDPANGQSKEYTLEEGQYVYIRGGVDHNLFIDTDSPCRLLNVEIGFQSGISPITISQLSENNDFPEFLKSDPPYIIIRDNGSLYTVLQNLHELLYESAEKNSGSHTPYSADIALASLLLISRLATQVITKSSAGTSTELYVRQAKKYISGHFDNPDDISISQLAEKIRISPAYLQRLFKSETGMTITEYITEMRMKKAKNLLRNTDMSIVDAAVNAGLGSRQRLTQLFTEQEGMSPGQYRKQWRNQQFEQGK